jgi:ABC-type nitrate/sulfonate/bicarbonate transport system substrate-binding protein
MSSRGFLLGAGLALAAAAAQAQAPAALRVMGFAGSSNWPVFVAQEKALFARQHVAVNLSAASNSTAQLASLVDGRIDIALTAMDNVVAREEDGLFAFLGVNNGGRFNLIVVPAVKSYADLKGRRLAVDAVATGYSFVLMDMLRRGGLAPGEYELVGVGSSRERLAAMRDGKAAGALLNAPQDAAAEAEGFVRLADSAEVLGRYQGSVGAARRAWAAGNADILVRYIRAQIAAVDWLYDPANRGEAIEILQRRVAGTTADNAARSYEELLHPTHGSLSRKAAMDLDGVRAVLRLRREFARPAKPLADVTRYYDASYYERALRHD